MALAELLLEWHYPQCCSRTSSSIIGMYVIWVLNIDTFWYFEPTNFDCQIDGSLLIKHK